MVQRSMVKRLSVASPISWDTNLVEENTKNSSLIFLILTQEKTIFLPTRIKKNRHAAQMTGRIWVMCIDTWIKNIGENEAQLYLNSITLKRQF